MAKDEEVHQTTLLWKSTMMGSKTQTLHMKVPPGYAVLDCGAAKESVWSETCRSDGTDMCKRRGASWR